MNKSSASASSQNRKNVGSQDVFKCNLCWGTFANRSEFHKHCEEQHNVTLSSRQGNLTTVIQPLFKPESKEEKGKKSIIIDLVDSSDSEKPPSPDNESSSSTSSSNNDDVASASQHLKKSNSPEKTHDQNKRGRGRPRKHVKGSDKAADNESSSNNDEVTQASQHLKKSNSPEKTHVQNKREHGRPRKHVKGSDKAADNESSSSTSSSNNEDVQASPHVKGSAKDVDNESSSNNEDTQASQNVMKSNPQKTAQNKRGRERSRENVQGSDKTADNKASAWQKSSSNQSQKTPIKRTSKKARTESREKETHSPRNRVRQNYQEHSSSSASSPDSSLSRSTAPVRPLKTKIKISTKNSKPKPEEENCLLLAPKTPTIADKGSKNKTSESRSSKTRIQSDVELDNNDDVTYGKGLKKRTVSSVKLDQTIPKVSSSPPSSSKMHTLPTPKIPPVPSPESPPSSSSKTHISPTPKTKRSPPIPSPPSSSSKIPKTNPISPTNSKNEEDRPLPKNVETKVRNFTCPVPSCCQSFEHKMTYINHLEIHEGMRPFVCPYCSYGYDSEIKLIEHVSIKHCAAASFECEKCGSTYKIKRFLDIHRKKCRVNRHR